MAAFKPLGDQARWRTIYDLLTAAPVEGIVTYDEIADALSLHPESDRHVIQMATRRAAKELLEHDRRSVDVVVNHGYRIVRAAEHMTLAKRQQKRSTKALKRGHDQVTYVDLSELDPETRSAFEVVARAFAAQMDINRRLDIGQKRLKESLDSMTERQDRSDDEIRRLRERLDRLEGTDQA
jgi:hypothetical protein